MKKKINPSEIFPIVYSLLSLHIILSISITLHFFNWLSSMLLGQSSSLSLRSTSCIMHCIIFHIISYGFVNKEAPTFKSINNINKRILTLTADVSVSSWHHSVNQQLLFLFWAMSFAKLSNLCLRMISSEIPETIQSERTLASWYVPANSIAVFVLTWDEQQCSLCHKILCSCFFLVRLLESSKLRKNLRRCSRSRRASWNCILRGVFNA